MITVGQPVEITLACADRSPTRVAGAPPMNTVNDPLVSATGESAQMHMSPTRAAG